MEVPPDQPAPEAPGDGRDRSPVLLWVFFALALAAIALNVLLWQKLSGMQEQLARQSAQSLALGNEARMLAKDAQALAQQAVAKASLQEAKVTELALQRSQYDELMRSLSRSRDENLLGDFESSLRLAQQQAQLTGSVAPLLAALKNVDQRIVRAAQPNLAVLQRAIAGDIERIKTVALSDTPAILIKLEDLFRRVDLLPMANARADAPKAPEPRRDTTSADSKWWIAAWQQVLTQFRGLVRVSRIEDPDAALVSPEQAFFLRENLKIRLLNVRMALLARHADEAREELDGAQVLITRFFDRNAASSKAALELLRQIRSQLNQLQVPRIDQTLSVLAGASSGR